MVSILYVNVHQEFSVNLSRARSCSTEIAGEHLQFSRCCSHNGVAFKHSRSALKHLE